MPPRDDARNQETEVANQRSWLAPYVLRHVRRREDAEDLVQEILVRATRALPRFRGDCPLSQWVLGIARHALYNHYSRDPYHSGRLTQIPDPLDSGDLQQDLTEPGPSFQTEQRDHAGRLLARMREVCSPDEVRALLTSYQGETLEDGARLLGLSASTMRSYYRRGRRKLLAHLVQADPDLLGGREAVLEAWTRCIGSADGEDRPTPAELEAWERPTGRQEAFRSACLKMAKHLPLVLVAARFWMDL